MQRMTRAAVLGLALAAVPAGTWAQTQRPPAARTQQQPAKAAAPSCTTAGRTIALVMDASGSMNARLPGGETRIEVARRAIKDVASFAPAGAQISLRLYGAQSPASRKNCEDTHLAVPSGPADASAIAASVEGAKAQGYTPIAHALGEAQGDFPAGAKERVIVLVSDGKETCKGDPLVAAKGLAAKGITVHTVGFIVDTAARMQLQNIARATGGTYFDAPVGPELPDRLKAAFSACKQVVKIPAKPGPGKLRSTSATWLQSHAIFNAETGEKVGSLDSSHLEAALPAGVYEVQFGPGRWKGIEVRSGETTVIAPGIVRVNNIQGNNTARLMDAETGEQHADMNRMSTTASVMPGLYDLRTGGANLVWPFVKIDGGGTTTLSLAVVRMMRGVKYQRARVVTAEGKPVESFDAVTGSISMPPGSYVVEVDDRKIPFEAAEGSELAIEPE
jgi:Mg-chelatase subunit ChlD